MAHRARPIGAHLATGNPSGLTRAEIAARKKAEARAQAPADKVRPPSWLSAPAKREFKRAAALLVKLGLVTNLDVDLLALYANTLVSYRDVTKQIEEQGRFVEHTNKFGATNKVSHPGVTQQKQLGDQLRMLAGELGLTPSGRAKLAIPREEPKEQTAFEAMFGDVIPLKREAR